MAGVFSYKLIKKKAILKTDSSLKLINILQKRENFKIL